jgi:tripeptidyl-peptidase-1
MLTLNQGETGNSPTIDPIYPDTTHPDGYLGKLECGIYKPTPVISMSYGQGEIDLPANYTKRTCNEFMKLGLQGVSIVASSGDFGVASPPGDIGTDGLTGCLGPDAKIFDPQFPSTCPYVTSVGGTQIQGTQILADGTEPGPYGKFSSPCMFLHNSSKSCKQAPYMNPKQS